MILFGGPRDGAVITAATPPPGYRDFSGVLCVWHLVRIDLMPFWAGHQFKRQVDHWHVQQEVERKMRDE